MALGLGFSGKSTMAKMVTVDAFGKKREFAWALLRET